MICNYTPFNNHCKQNSRSSFAPKLPLAFSIIKFALRIESKIKTLSTFKISANTLQKSKDNECEQSEQLSPISLIFDTKPTNCNQTLQFSKKTKIRNINIERPTLPRFLPKTLIITITQRRTSPQNRKYHEHPQQRRSTTTSPLTREPVTLNFKVNSENSPKTQPLEQTTLLQTKHPPPIL